MLCAIPSALATNDVRLITLDPGHFHAGLVQKFMYPQVNPLVHVYAPEGPELQDHLKRVAGFNARPENPTRWEEKVYAGPDFLDRMLSEKAGNVVVLAGNNAHKTEYIDRSIQAGFNVLADKPMAITPDGFKLLCQAFDRAAKNRLLLYDIMTERFEIMNILQRGLARDRDLFGALEKGRPEQPAIEMESVHHFFKEVAGKPLIRPAWFYDVRQQGEAVPDVGTHLLDCVQWIGFPDQVLDWKKDIKVFSAHRWPTKLTPEQFKRSTGLDQFPDFLKKDVGPDGALDAFANGDVLYTIRGACAKVTALWNFEAPAGAGDTHYAVVRGTHATLTILQGPDQGYKPTLYVENRSTRSPARFEQTLRAALARLNTAWPGLDIKEAKVSLTRTNSSRPPLPQLGPKPGQTGGKLFQIVVPDQYRVGHETHFSQVTEAFLRFLAEGKMPAWEVPNMIAKYYTSTEAYRLSHSAQPGPR